MSSKPKTHRKMYAWNDEDQVSTGSAITLTVLTSLTLGFAYIIEVL